MTNAAQWTPERVSALIALWAEDLPASEIGRRLGMTKNAVIGKVHRLGLPKRGSPIQAKTETAELVRLEDLAAGMCSWPDGEPGTDDFQFCGAPAVPGKPYCAKHCATAYVTGSKDRKGTAAA